MCTLLRFLSTALTLALLPCPARLPAAPTEDLAQDEQIVKRAGVGVDGVGLLDFFRKRTLTAADQRRLGQLVSRLGDATYRQRSQASRDLLAVGPPALPALRQALQSPDAEVRSRAAKCVFAIEQSPGPALPLAALRLLRVRRPEQACPVLLAYLPFADNEDVAEEAVSALPEVGFKDGKADPSLAAALRDAHPARRAAAGLVLGRQGNAEQRRAVRRLLADENAHVRLAAAHGLVLGKDKSGIPVLVGLLADGPLDVAQKAEEVLAELVDAPVTKVELAADSKTRRQVQQAWAGWWKTQETKIDLGRLTLDGPLARANRAKKATRECLDALLRLDASGFKKTLKFPFYMQNPGGDQLRDATKIDQMFAMLNGMPDIKQQLKKIKFKITGTGKVGEYKEAMPGEKTFLGQFRKQELVIVYLQIITDGRVETNGDAAMFVRIVGGRAWVVGLGNGRRNK